MKSLLKISAIALTLITCVSIQSLKGQSIKLFFGDLLNGTINGAALGGATMALQDSDDLGPLRVGVGVGILYGAGVGIYDTSILPKGQPFYISGTFNSGHNSSIIVLLDTFYGAAAGAALGAAVSLIAYEPILDGLQYGSGAGAWLGFGFGLVDAFILAEGPDDFTASAQMPAPSPVDGFIQYTSASKNINIGLIHPTVMAQPVFKGHTLQKRISMGVELVNVHIGL